MFDPYLDYHVPTLGEVMVIDINEQRQHWRRLWNFPSKLFSIGLYRLMDPC